MARMCGRTLTTILLVTAAITVPIGAAPQATAAVATITGAWVYQSGTLFGGDPTAAAGKVTVTVSAATISGAPGYVGVWSHLEAGCRNYGWNASAFSSSDRATWPPWVITTASGTSYAGWSFGSVGQSTINGTSECWPEWFLSSTWQLSGSTLTQTVTCPASDPTSCGAGYSRTGVWVRPTSSSAVTGAQMRAAWTDIYTPVRRAYGAYHACAGTCPRAATTLWHRTGWARTQASTQTQQWPAEVREPVIATFVHWNKAARAAVRYETSSGSARTQWYRVMSREIDLVNTYLDRAIAALNAVG